MSECAPSGTWRSTFDILERSDEDLSVDDVETIVEARVPAWRQLWDSFALPAAKEREQIKSGKITLPYAQIATPLTKSQIDTIVQLSDLLQIREDLASQIFLNALDTNKSDENTPTSLNVKNLSVFLNAYFEERLSLVHSLSALLRLCEDDGHAYHALANTTLDHILSDPMRFMKSVVLKQYQDKRQGHIQLPERGLFASDLLSSDDLAELKLAYARQHFKEQRALLELIFLLFYSRIHADADYAFLILELLTSVSKANASIAADYSLDSVIQSELHHVFYLESLVSLEIFNLEELVEYGNAMESSTDNTAPPTPPWPLVLLHSHAPSAPQSVTSDHPLVRLNRLIRRHCVHDTHASPFLLAWSIVLCHLWSTDQLSPLMRRKLQLSDEDEEHVSAEDAYWRGDENLLAQLQSDETDIYKLFASRAFSLDVLGFFMRMLSSDLMLHDAHPNVTGYKSVLKGLLIAFVQEFDLSLLPDTHLRAFLCCFARTLRAQPLLCYQYWTGDFLNESRRAPLQVAQTRFPVDPLPFLQLLCALTSLPVDDLRHTVSDSDPALNPVRRACQQAVYAYVAQLSTLTERAADAVLPHLEIQQIADDLMTAVPLQDIPLLPWMQRRAFLVLPRGMPVQVHVRGEGQQATLTWHLPYSGWQLCLYVLQCVAHDAWTLPLTAQHHQSIKTPSPRDLSALLYGTEKDERMSHPVEVLCWMVYALYAVVHDHPANAAQLLQCSLGENEASPVSMHVMDVLHALVEKHLRPLSELTASTCTLADRHLLVAELKCIHSLLRVYPTLSWQACQQRWLFRCARKETARPLRSGRDERADALWKAASAAFQPLHRVVRHIECAQGTYPCLREFVALVGDLMEAQVWCFQGVSLREDAFQAVFDNDDSTALTVMVMYLMRDVWPYYLSWRYVDVTEQFTLTTLLCRVVSRLATETLQWPQHWPLTETAVVQQQHAAAHTLTAQDVLLNAPMPSALSHAAWLTLRPLLLLQTHSRTLLEPFFEMLTVAGWVAPKKKQPASVHPALRTALEACLETLCLLVRVQRCFVASTEMTPLVWALQSAPVRQEERVSTTHVTLIEVLLGHIATALPRIDTNHDQHHSVCLSLAVDLVCLLAQSASECNAALPAPRHLPASMDLEASTALLQALQLDQTLVPKEGPALLRVAQWPLKATLLRTVRHWMQSSQRGFAAEILVGHPTERASLPEHALLHWLLHRVCCVSWTALSVLPDEALLAYLELLRESIALLACLLMQASEQALLVHALLSVEETRRALWTALESVHTCFQQAESAWWTRPSAISTRLPWTLSRLLKTQPGDVSLDYVPRGNCWVSSPRTPFVRVCVLRRRIERDLCALTSALLPLRDTYTLTPWLAVMRSIMTASLSETLEWVAEDLSALSLAVLEEPLWRALQSKHAALLVKRPVEEEMDAFQWDVSATYRAALLLGLDVDEHEKTTAVVAERATSSLSLLLQSLVAFNDATAVRTVLDQRASSLALLLGLLGDALRQPKSSSSLMDTAWVAKQRTQCLDQLLEMSSQEMRPDLPPLAAMSALSASLWRDTLLVDLYLLDASMPMSSSTEMDVRVALALMHSIQSTDDVLTTHLRSPWLEERVSDARAVEEARQCQRQLMAAYVASREQLWRTLLVALTTIHTQGNTPVPSLISALQQFLPVLCRAITLNDSSSTKTVVHDTHRRVLLALLQVSLQLLCDHAQPSTATWLKMLEDTRVLSVLLSLLRRATPHRASTRLALAILQRLTSNAEGVAWLTATQDRVGWLTRSELHEPLSQGLCEPGTATHTLWCDWLDWWVHLLGVCPQEGRLLQDAAYLMDAYRAQCLRRLAESQWSRARLVELTAIARLLRAVARPVTQEEEQGDAVYLVYVRHALLLIQQLTYLLTHPLQQTARLVEEGEGSSAKDFHMESALLDVLSALLGFLAASSPSFVEQAQARLQRSVSSAGAKAVRGHPVLSLIVPSMRIAMAEQQVSLGVFVEGHACALQALQRKKESLTEEGTLKMNDVLQQYMHVFFLAMGQWGGGAREWQAEARAEAASMVERTRAFYEETTSTVLAVDGKPFVHMLQRVLQDYVL